MNITRENSGDLELSLKVEINENDYQEKVIKQLKDYQRKATVPGFRKGMAPLALIQKLYKTTIVADEVQHILSESLFKYIEDEKLEVIGSPLSNDEKTGTVDFETQKDFVFYFDAALFPKVAINWDAIDVKMTQIKVAAKDIDEQITDMARRYGKFETPEIVQETDFLYGKAVETDKDGNKIENGIDTFSTFEVAKVKSDENKQLFIGKKNGDKIVFNPAKAFDIEVMEKTLHLNTDTAKAFKSNVEYTISGISRITPHEINEEFFKKIFPNEEINDLETFKKALKKETEKAYEEQSQLLFINQVRKALTDQFSAPIPVDFLQRWIASRGQKDVTLESVKNDWDEKYLPSLKWEFIEAELRKIKEIEATKNEVIDYVKNIMKSRELPNVEEDPTLFEERLEKAARAIADDRNNVAQIYDKIYADKTFALFNEQVKPEVEKVTLKEFAERQK